MLFARTLTIIFHGLPIMLPTLAVSAVLLAGPAIVAVVLSMRSEMAPAPEPVASQAAEIATDPQADTESPVKEITEEADKPGRQE